MTFFLRTHGAYFLYELLLPPMIEAEEEKKNQKKDTKEQVHKGFPSSLLCYIL